MAPRIALVITMLLVLPAMVRSEIVIEDATAPFEDLELAFTAGGKVEKVYVKRGQMVKKGQLLMTLEAKEQEAQIKQAEFDIDAADLEIQRSQKTADLLKTKFEMNEYLFKEGRAGSKFEFQQSQIDYERGKIDVKIVIQMKQGKELGLKIQNALYERYTLQAPIDGMIEDVLVSKGETVQALKPVAMLVVTNPLKIDAAVPIHEALKVNVGDTAWITSKLAGFTKTMTGKVTFKAKVADLASETLRVGIEMPNERDMPAGTSVAVSFAEPPPRTLVQPQSGD